MKASLEPVEYRARYYETVINFEGYWCRLEPVEIRAGRLDLLDDPAAVEKKLKKAKCVPKEVEGNGVIAFVEHVIFRALALKTGKTPQFVVQRRNGEPLVYEFMDKLKEDYTADILTPQLLKSMLTAYLNELLSPIEAEYDNFPKWQAAKKGVVAKPDGHVEGENAEKVIVGHSIEETLEKLKVNDEKK